MAVINLLLFITTLNWLSYHWLVSFYINKAPFTRPVLKIWNRCKLQNFFSRVGTFYLYTKCELTDQSSLRWPVRRSTRGAGPSRVASSGQSGGGARRSGTASATPSRRRSAAATRGTPEASASAAPSRCRLGEDLCHALPPPPPPSSANDRRGDLPRGVVAQLASANPSAIHPDSPYTSGRLTNIR